MTWILFLSDVTAAWEWLLLGDVKSAWSRLLFLSNP
jgi:hypothetical protein